MIEVEDQSYMLPGKKNMETILFNSSYFRGGVCSEKALLYHK
jgi:hypothetical protein